MADILLDFGVTPSSAAAIQSTINRIVNGLNPKIKVDIDGKAVEVSAQKELAKVDDLIIQISKDLNKIGDSKNTSVQAVATEFNGLLKSLQGLRGSLLSGGKNVPFLDTFLQKIDAVVAKRKELYAVLERTGQSAFLNTYKQGDSSYEKALGDVESRLRQVKKLQDDLASGKITFSDPNAAAILTDTANRLQRIHSELDGMPVEVFKTAMTGVANSLNSLSDSKIKLIGQDTAAYASNLDQIATKLNTVRQIKEDIKLGKIVDDGTIAATLDAIETKLNGLQSNLKNLTAEDLSKSMAEVNAEINRINENKVLALAKDTTEYNRALNQVVSIQNKVADAQERLSSGKATASPATKASLEAVAGAAAQLRAELEAGKMAPEEFAQRLSKLAVDANKATGAISNTNSVLASIKQGFASMFSAYRVITLVWQEIKKMTQAVIELDSSMTQLQIVTNATDQQMAQFFTHSAALAKGLGTNISDVLGSIETFSRLGYNLDDASILAKYATVLQNVADVSTEAATTGLTSIIKGYNMNVENAEHAADVLVQVGQKYAVSASEMMEAYEKSSAALNATNTSFEKSAGLIAAANAAVQNASTVGVALKTVSARIRGSKTDLEELGENVEGLADGFSKYAKEVKALTGFDIMVDGTTNQFKDLYDIFDGIAAVWDKLSDTQQARVSEILGGTRQLQVISSILTNWDDAVDAYADAMDSAGVATQANDIYMESVEAHLGQLKATFQELSADTFTDNFLNQLIDLAKGALEVLDAIMELTGGFSLLGVSIAGISIVNFEKVSKAIKSWREIDSLQKLINPVESLGMAFGKTGAEAVAFGNSLLAVSGVLVATVAAYAILDKAIFTSDEAIKRAQESAQAYESQKAKVESLNGELETTRARIDELRAKGSLSIVEQQELSDLEAANEKLQTRLEIEKQIAQYKQSAAAHDANEALTNASFGLNWKTGVNFADESARIDVSWIEGRLASADTIIDYIKEEHDILDQLDSVEKELYDKLGNLTPGSAAHDRVLKQIQYLGDIRAEIESDLAKNMETVRTNEKSLYDDFGNVVKGYETTAEAVADMWDYIKTDADEAVEEQQKIDAFLERPTIEKYVEKVKQAFESAGQAMGETEFREFFPELAAEADKSGIEIVDIINTIAAALGLLNFDEIRNQLKRMKPSDIGISAQDWFNYIGGLTDEQLEKLYNAMHSGMDFSTWSLPDLDAFLAETEEATTSVESLADAIDKAGTAAESIGKITDAYEKLADGSLELTDVVELIKEFPDLAGYVDMTAEGFGNLDEGLRQVARKVPKELVNELEKFANTADLTEAQRQSILGLADALVDMPTSGVEDITGEFVTLHDAIMDAKQAVSEIEEATSKDTNTGYESRSEAFQEMMELFKAGATGSSSKIWDIAEAMGYIGKQDPATLWEWVQAREAWYDTGEDGKLDPYDSSGIESFLKYVSQTEGIQEKLAELGATFKYEDGVLDMDFDNASWEEIANAIGITKEEFTDLMIQAGQFFDIDWEDLNDIADYVDEVALSGQSAEDKLSKMQEAARKALSETGIPDNTIESIISKDGVSVWKPYMDDYDEATQRIIRDLLNVKAEMSALEGGDPMGLLHASQNAEDLAGKLNEVGIKATALDNNVVQIPIESFATSLAESGWSEESISAYVATLMDNENFEFTSEGEVVADTEKANEAINEVIGKKEQLSDPESTRYTVTGSGASVLNSIMTQWSSVTQDKTTDYYINKHYSSTGSVNVDVPEVNGTAHASGNWGTPRTEDALTGELGREIVVDPNSGRWYTVGDNGAEFVRIPKGAIVFNHKQTEALLANGYVAGRGKAYLQGTAYASSSGGIFKATSSSYGGYSSSKSTTSKSSSYSSGNKVSSSTANSSSNTELENWFEKQYAYHQHLLAMEQESQADYLNWLMTAYKKAYNEGIITLEDYYQYQEEVFEGLRNIYDDYLNDIEHEVSMREHFKGEEQAILNLYKNAIKSVKAEINEARKAGLKDNDEYIQTLQDRYWSLYEALEDMRNSYTESAKDATDELIDLRINMLKQGIKDEKDANSARLKNLKEFYDKQKDLLKDAYDEDKYLKEQTEKRKSVTDLQMELERLSYDNSAWAQKRRLELQEDLAKAQEELSEFEKDHALEVAQEQLDELYEKQEEAYNNQNDLLDAKLNNAKLLYDQALKDVRHGSADLYNEMIEYNNIYGDGIRQTIVDAWEKAYAALNDYMNLYGKTYNKINLTNETGYDQTKKSTENAAGSWDTSAISDKGTKVTTAQVSKAKAKTEAEKVGTWKSNSKGWWYEYGDGTYAKSEWKTINGKKYHFDSKGWMETGWIKDGSTWYYLNSSGAMQTGWIKLNGTWYYLDKDGKMVTGTQKIDGKSYTFNSSGAWLGYASGTKNAKAGLHRIDERGDEFVFESANGNRYRMFSGGEKVLNAKATDFLYQFATSGGKILTDLIKSSISRNDLDSISNSRQNVDITMGDIIINGNADQRTVSQIRREQREGMDYVLTQFARLRG